MTTAFLIAAAWYASGVAGAILLVRANGDDRVGARGTFMVFPLFGPVTLLMGLVAVLGAVVSNIYFWFEGR